MAGTLHIMTPTPHTIAPSPPPLNVETSPLAVTVHAKSNEFTEKSGPDMTSDAILEGGVPTERSSLVFRRQAPFFVRATQSKM